MRIRPLNLRQKILFGYGAALVLVVLVGVWAVVNLAQLGKASEQILRENYRSILAAESMIDALERQDSGLLLILLGYKEQGIKQFHENETQFLEWLGRARDNVTIKGEAEVVDSIEQGFTKYLISFSELQANVGFEKNEAIAFYHEKSLSQFLEVRKACVRLREMNQQTMVQASERTRRISVRTIWSTAAMGIAAVFLGLVLSLLLSRILVRPLREVIAASEKIASGDYDVSVSLTSGDELGLLVKGFNAMSHKLKAFNDLQIDRLIAEQRRSQAIIQSVPDGVIIIGEDLKVVAANPVAAEALGFSPAEAQGKHLLEVFNNEELFAHVKSILRTKKQKSGILESALSVDQGKEKKHFRVSVTPVKTDRGQILGVVILLQDITRLQELDRLKSEFVMAASHELRTPLTAIILSLGVLEENVSSKLGTKDKELLGASLSEAERLRSLVNDLLDLSRIESGKMEMRFEPVEVSSLARKAIAMLEGQAEEKGIELREELDENLLYVKADADKIIWVLTNLIGNALRYTDSGGHVLIQGKKLKDFVHVTVADDGVGIPEEYQSRIFDKFVQVDDGRKTGGTGLGLPLCREIVRAHGGTIWVKSTPGQGSSFTFTLKVAETK
ncbi:PAS domain-containing protein [candidate division WOR-3 bacterium]|nr:PAS domain-containing protein [candidate division WOR-3 bacterium]